MKRKMKKRKTYILLPFFFKSKLGSVVPVCNRSFSISAFPLGSVYHLPKRFPPPVASPSPPVVLVYLFVCLRSYYEMMCCTTRMK